MNIHDLKIKMDDSLWRSFDLHLSDLTIFEFGETLQNVMIFLDNSHDLYYYYPENNIWKVNEGWTYFKKDKDIDETKMAFLYNDTFPRQTYKYNDLIYIGNWNPYKKYCNSNYYHFKNIHGVEYLYDKLLGTWKIKVTEKGNLCCCKLM